MEDNLPLILITNDDGITAPGIRTLVECVMHLGRVVVVAPDSPQSGMSHAVTFTKPLWLETSDEFKDLDIEAYACSGTPADCVKLAKDQIFHRTPDFCFSGINHGSNASVNILYSGTMSAATEAAIEGIPSIGFSLCDHSWEADFNASRSIITHLAENLVEHSLPEYTLLNVNIPKGSEVKGMKVCRQARAKWVERYDKRTDPYGRTYFWLTGEFVNLDSDGGTDEDYLAEGSASIVPVQFDLTSKECTDFINKHWLWDEN